MYTEAVRVLKALGKNKRRTVYGIAYDEEGRMNLGCKHLGSIEISSMFGATFDADSPDEIWESWDNDADDEDDDYGY